MSSVLAPAEVRVSASTVPASGLFWRIGGFFLILAVEVILISSQTQHVAFSGAHGLAGWLFTLGTWKIRVPITLAVIFLLFWQAKGRQNVSRISASQLGRGIAWPWLVLHLGAISFFALLSTRLLNHPSNDNGMNAMVLFCLAPGVAARGFVRSLAGEAMARDLSRQRGIFGCTWWCWARELVSRPLSPSGFGIPWPVGHSFCRGRYYALSCLDYRSDPAARVPWVPLTFLLKWRPACSGYEGIGLILVFTSAASLVFLPGVGFSRASALC